MPGEFLLDADPATMPCRNGADDPELWFAEGVHLRSLEDQERAKKLCGTCPVRVQCLESAMDSEQGMRQPQRFGIYGGLDPYDRAELAGFRVCRPVPKRQFAVCGSPEGYRQHQRRKEAACQRCATAMSEYQASRRAASKGAEQ